MYIICKQCHDNNIGSNIKQIYMLDCQIHKYIIVNNLYVRYICTKYNILYFGHQLPNMSRNLDIICNYTYYLKYM